MIKKRLYIKRIRNWKLLNVLNTLTVRHLIFYPKIEMLSMFVYSIKKIINYLQKSACLKNIKISLEFQLILKNFFYILTNKNPRNLRVLIKKTFSILLKYPGLTKKKVLLDITHKMLLLCVKYGNNFNSFKNILRLKKEKLQNKSSVIANEFTNAKIFKKFIGALTKKGEKTKSRNILTKALTKIHKESGISINIILLKVFRFLKTSVEAKKIRVRRTFHMVPFPINENRQIFLIINWILASLKKGQKIHESLALEITKTAQNLKSGAIKHKNFNIAVSLKNKSNLHFRW